MIAPEMIPLNGRIARCFCGRERPSATTLAMFRYRGAGSSDALETCRDCRYADVAHERGRAVLADLSRCPAFVPHGPYAVDLFYCGCEGWD